MRFAAEEDRRLACRVETTTTGETPVFLKLTHYHCGYRIDILFEKELVIELKAVEQLLPIHEAQLLTYMKLANIPVGLLINFNVRLLKNGIKRFVL